MTSEHAKWLRDEQQKAYATLSIAGEEVQQFFRSGLFALAESDNNRQRDEAESRWHELRAELRKAYNQVALFGANDARAASLSLWQTARNRGNNLFHSLHGIPGGSISELGLFGEIRTVASELGTAGNRFLEACRNDLQNESNGALR
jgi:hypothetical protein